MHRCNGYNSNKRTNSSMNCYFDKNATLYRLNSILQILSNVHIRLIFLRVQCQRKLQTMAIFLNFRLNNIGKWEHTHTGMHTLRARALVRLLESFSKKRWSKMNGQRKKSLSIQINGNWSHFVLKIESYWYWCDCLSQSFLFAQKNGVFRAVKSRTSLIAPFTFCLHTLFVISLSFWCLFLY